LLPEVVVEEVVQKAVEVLAPGVEAALVETMVQPAALQAERQEIKVLILALMDQLQVETNRRVVEEVEDIEAATMEDLLHRTVSVQEVEVVDQVLALQSLTVQVQHQVTVVIHYVDHMEMVLVPVVLALKV
jgi:hypothetical protein